MQNTKQALIIPLDNGVIQSIRKEFSEHSENTMKKIMFITYLIKKGKYNNSTKKSENYFEISRTKLKTYLSLNKELSPIIDKLINLGIIAKKGGYINSVSYQKYTYTAKSTGKTTEIFINRTEGKYVSRYIDDNYTVIYSSKKKVETPKEEVTPVETPNNNLIETLLTEISELKKRVKMLEADRDTLFDNDEILEEMIDDLRPTVETLVEETEECPGGVIEDIVEPESSVEIEESPKPVQVLNTTDQLSETEQYIVRLAIEGQGFYKSKNKEKIYEYICKIDTIYSNKAFRTVVDKCIELSLVA